MIGQLPVIGLALILAGFVIAAISALAVMGGAFKKNLFWGVACLLIPLATLAFPLRFWRDAKGLFIAQLGGTMLLLAGLGLMFSDRDIRSGLSKALDHPADLAAAVGNDGDGAPPAPSLSQVLRSLGQKPAADVVQPRNSAAQSSATPPAQNQQPVADAKEASKNKARELFATAQAWFIKLQQKRPAPGASPEEIRAFNQEYAQYNALLEQYKKEAAAAASR